MALAKVCVFLALFFPLFFSCVSYLGESDNSVSCGSLDIVGAHMLMFRTVFIGETYWTALKSERTTLGRDDSGSYNQTSYKSLKLTPSHSLTFV